MVSDFFCGVGHLVMEFRLARGSVTTVLLFQHGPGLLSDGDGEPGSLAELDHFLSPHGVFDTLGEGACDVSLPVRVVDFFQLP